MTLGRLSRHWAKTVANKTAYVDRDRFYTWRTFNSRVNQLAHFLWDLGVRRGDRVANLGADSVQIPEIVVACAKLGAIRVGINHRYAPPEVDFILRDSGAKVLVVDAASRHLADAVRGHLPDLNYVVGFGADHGYPYDYELELAKRPDAEPRGSDESQLSDIILLSYTSGSTGRPKGAIWLQHNLMGGNYVLRLCEMADKHDVFLHNMPAGGAPTLHITRNICLGSTCVIMRTFDAGETLELIERHRVTRTVWVPTVLVRVLNHPDISRRDLSSLKLVLYGAAPVTPGTVRQAFETFGGPKVMQMYGMTELPAMVSLLSSAEHIDAISNGREHRLASAGQPLWHCETRIVDEHGQDVPPGEAGEIACRSPFTIPGYWNQPEMTAEAIRHGWLHTGDMGRLDEDSYLYVVDRKKFMIISGGYNIYPQEVENVLGEHPSVKETCVFGAPDPEWGEVVVALVTLKAERRATPDDLREFCSPRMGKFKLPKVVRIVDDLPRGATGKLLKNKARENYLTENRLI